MTATFHVGDAIEVMNKLPEKSVDLILTSPPFLALRSYLPTDHPDKALEGGSQATPGAFIDWLIDVVEACDRVLAPHGSLCIELGDTYSGSGGAGGDYADSGLREGQPKFSGSNVRKAWIVDHDSGRRNPTPGWPLPKSLSLIPELFRLTLVYGTNPLTGRQTDRWRLRNVVRWVRPNPPVGALGDKFRPATSELMVFCKSAKRYFDLDAVREPYKPGQSGAALSFPANFRGTEKGRRSGGVSDQIAYEGAGAPPLDWWMIANSYANNSRLTVGKIREAAEFASVSDSEQDILRRAALVLADLLDKDTAGAPPLDWWNIPPGGYEGAHYAVFPPELCIKPIKAMCPEKVCRVCGEPSRRIVSQLNEERTRLSAEILRGRQAAGFSQKEVAEWFLSVTGGLTGCVWNWENGKNVPTADQWPILRERLTLSGEFDELIAAESRWNDAEYVLHGDPGRQNAEDYAQAKMGQNPSAQAMPKGRATKIPKDAGFSDCGHNDFRNGLVLDPFVGSGTTLMVATGHGRDAIGIDLDSRNYDLALDRVGPFILKRAET